MVAEEELEGFRRDRYFARSWALLTRHAGWIKPVLLLTVALLVPLVGWWGVMGYALEWARLTAWGVNAAPKQRGVRVVECIVSGARAFVVLLLWSVVAGIVVGLLSALPLVGGIVAAAWAVLSLFFGVVVMAAELRATIYRRIVPGLRVSAVWQMVRHDPMGLLRVFGMVAVGGVLMGLVSSIVAFSALASILPTLLYYVAYLGEYSQFMSDAALASGVVAFVFEALAAMGPVLIVLLLLDGFMGVITLLLGYTGVALWMRQFNVPAWRADEDPLPPFVSDPRDPAPDSPAGNSWQTGEACPEPEPVSASGPVQEEGGAQAEKDEGPSLPPADDLDSLT